MILSIGITQFVFLTLGILALQILLKAGGYAPNVASEFPPLAVYLHNHVLWMFCVPAVWLAFASLCARFNRGILSNATARATGIALTCGIFLTYLSAASRFF